MLWVADHIVFPSKIEGSYAFNPEDPFLDPLTRVFMRKGAEVGQDNSVVHAGPFCRPRDFPDISVSDRKVDLVTEQGVEHLHP